MPMRPLDRPADLDRVSLDRLGIERRPFGMPVLERAGFKIEIQHPPGGIAGGDAAELLS